MGGNCVLSILLFYSAFLISQTGSQSLKFLYTAVITGDNISVFTVVFLNEEQILYHNNNKMIAKTDWMNKTEGSSQWKTTLFQIESDEDELKTFFQKYRKHKVTTGNHTLQRMYSCGMYNGIIQCYDQYGYDGEDFMSLDFEALTWNKNNDAATAVIADLEFDTETYTRAKKSFLMNDCIEQLKQYTPHIRKAEKPKTLVFQKSSSPPVIVCTATDFLPSAVNITWQKEGKEVKENVEVGETLPNYNGTFQKRVILNVSLKDLQKNNYTCVIQHSSLEKDQVLPAKQHRILMDSGQESTKGSDRVIFGSLIGVLIIITASL